MMRLLRIPFPLPAHQTGHTVFPHPAFDWFRHKAHVGDTLRTRFSTSTPGFP